MRWQYDDFEPYVGHTRVVEKFLWFPVWLNGEARWLERAKIKQEYMHLMLPEDLRYIDICWVD